MPRGLTYRTDVWRVENAAIGDVAVRLDRTFPKLGWRVSGRDRIGESIEVRAENSSIRGIDLAHYRDPRVARILIMKAGDGARVEFRFELNRAYRWFLIFASFLAAAALSGVVRWQSGLESVEGSLAGLVGITVLLFAFVTLIALLLYSPAYDDVRLHVLREIGEIEGGTARIERSPALGRGTIIPLWFFLGWICLEFLPREIGNIGLAFRESWRFVIGQRDEAPLEIVYVVPLLLLAVLAVLGSVLVLNRSDRKGRFAMFSPGLHVGMYGAFYCLIPPFFQITNGMFPGDEGGGDWISTIVILTFAVSYLGFLLVNLAGFHDSYLNWKSEFAFDSEEPEFLSLSKPFIVFALIFWLGLVGFSVLTLYHVLSGIEWLVSTEPKTFPNAYMVSMAETVGPIGVVVYVAPVLLLVGLLAWRVLRQALEVVHAGEVDGHTRILVERVCGDFGVRPPVILPLEDPAPIVQVGYVFPLGMVLRISNTVIRRLPEDQLTAIIAHEAYHVQKHSGLIWVLDALSTWTLFGSGFLSMVLDTRKWEFEADAHAVSYLQSQGMDPRILASALRRIATLQQYRDRLASSATLGAMPESATDVATVARSPMDKLRWVFAVFLGDLILSYIHPTLAERIDRIEAMA